MKIYRIIKLKNGIYKLQSKETCFFKNPLYRWKNEYIFSGLFENVKHYYDECIKERDKKRNAVIDEIVISEERNNENI